MQKLFLLRHGQVPQITPRRFIGCTDVPLDATGRKQASAMGLVLKNVPLDKILCSDLGRTKHTAKLVLEARGTAQKAVPMPLLREINLGRWEGLTKAEVEDVFPGQFEQRGRDMGGFAPEQGESFAQVQSRAAHFLAAMEKETANTVLAVSHAGFIRTLLCRVQDIPLANMFDVEQDYCHLNLLELVDGQWMVRFSNQHAEAVAARLA